jgi:Tol biopolymer transport system component
VKQGILGIQSATSVGVLKGAGFYQAYGETLEHFGTDFYGPTKTWESEEQFHAFGGGDPLPADWSALKAAYRTPRTWDCGPRSWDDVVWALNGDIVTAKFDGSSQRVVVPGNGYSLDTPLISPDGRNLAYRKYPPEPVTSQELCVFDGSTTKCATIPQSGGPANKTGFTYDYTWDAASRKLYFTRNEQSGRGEIWVIDFDAANPTEQFFLRPGVSRTFGVSISGDGRKLVMVQDPGFWTYNNFISIYDFTTGQSTTIYPSNGRRDFWASYSRVRDEFVWIQMDSSDQGDVWRMNADGTGAVNLTPGTPGTRQFAAGDQLWPRFSPDGSQIFWAENGKLWVMNRDGSGKQPLMDFRSSPGYEWRFDVARTATPSY